MPCPGDLTGNGEVGTADLLQVLWCWGSTKGACAAADLSGEGNVGVADLLIVIGNWGPCVPDCGPGSGSRVFAPSFIRTPAVRETVTGTAVNSDTLTSAGPLELNAGESAIVAVWLTAAVVHDVTSAKCWWGLHDLTPIIINPPSGQTLNPLGPSTILRVYKLENPGPGSETITIICAGSNTRSMLIGAAISDAQGSAITGTITSGMAQGAGGPLSVSHTPGRSNVLILSAHALTASFASPATLSDFSHGPPDAEVSVDNRELALQSFVNADGSQQASIVGWAGEAWVGMAVIEIRPPE